MNRAAVVENTAAGGACIVSADLPAAHGKGASVIYARALTVIGGDIICNRTAVQIEGCSLRIHNARPGRVFDIAADRAAPQGERSFFVADAPSAAFGMRDLSGFIFTAIG